MMSIRNSASGARAFGVLALAALVGLCVLRSSIGTRLDSLTVDEPWHIVAGTAYVRSGDFHLNPEHPPLVKLWVGMLMPDDFRLGAPKVLSEKTQERTFVEHTMFFDNDPLRAQQRARVAMWSFHGVLLLALGLLLRLGDGAHAIVAYQRMLEQTRMPLDPAFAQQLRAQIARIEAGEDPSKLQPLRNPWLE